jgi:hypothetical protein
MPTKQEQQLRQLNEVLEKWQGAQAQFWSYTASLANLEIRLFSEQRPGDFRVVCSPCVSISGPVYWEGCELELTTDSSDDSLFLLQDREAGVRVCCRQLHTIEKVEPLFAPSGGGEQGNSGH